MFGRIFRLLLITLLILYMLIFVSCVTGRKESNPAIYHVIKGKVLHISEEGLITIDVGKDKNVKVGMDFGVYHNDTWITRIRIYLVEENQSIAALLGNTLLRKKYELVMK